MGTNIKGYCKRNRGLNMKQEDKELLLKDLCARLPYGVICKSNSYRNILFNSSHISLIESEEIKPYLRPMSSMTEEEEKEYENCFQSDDTTSATLLIDFYNKHHFDYRGLINKGLALEASEDMYN